MKNINQLCSRLLALALLWVQIPVCGSAQQSKIPVTSPGLQFVSGQSARRIPFEFVGNHIYLRARVNDSAPIWFLLDTGATASYLDVQPAKALGLGVQGNFIKATSISFPGVRLLNQAFSVQPLGFWIYDGHAVDGMLGYDFITRFVVELDYVNKNINLHAPQSYRYPGSGEVVPLIMLEDDSGGKVPLVRARIVQHGRTPIEGKFIADTAVRAAVTFNTPFVETNKLLQPGRKTIQAALGGGAMVRESQQPIGRLSNIQIGSFMINDSVAIFFQDQKGVLASPEFDGVIGGDILRRFKVIFDYSREQMILKPNRYFREPYEYDMSGALLVVEGADFKTFKIRQVIENSPASEAGLRLGDVILAVNRKPASKLTLEQVRQMFKQEGRSYRLRVKRGEQKIETTIKLRRLI
jgi:hypothetical protein